MPTLVATSLLGDLYITLDRGRYARHDVLRHGDAPILGEQQVERLIQGAGLLRVDEQYATWTELDLALQARIARNRADIPTISDDELSEEDVRDALRAIDRQIGDGRIEQAARALDRLLSLPAVTDDAALYREASERLRTVTRRLAGADEPPGGAPDVAPSGDIQARARARFRDALSC